MGFALALSASILRAHPEGGGRCGNPAGSPAMLNGKPRQVRKEATVVVMRVPGSGWQGGLSNPCSLLAVRLTIVSARRPRS